MITVGCDPELFLSKNNIPVSVIGKIGGSKEEPKEIKTGFVQEDNVMLELNPYPATSTEEFKHNVTSLINEVKSILTGYDLLAVPSLTFPKEELLHPLAMESGCSAFMNAYTFEDTSVDLSVSNKRYAGGHIHVGTSTQDEINLVKWMDLLLAVPSVLIDNDVDRRSTYGKAGLFRLKEYGIEYRSLSNFWLNSPELIEWVFNQTVRAEQMSKVHNIDDYLSKNKVSSYDIQSIIDNSDTEGAEKCMKTFQI